MAWENLRFAFAGVRVLVTGGTSGIGAGIAAAFADAGADVTITGTRAHGTNYDTDLSRYRYLSLDIEDNAAIDGVADAVDACDVLVNNAGCAFIHHGLDEHDPDVFARAVQVHLISGFRLTQRLADKLAKSWLLGGGVVIGIGSTTSFTGVAMVLGYGAGKTGLLGMTRGLAVDLGPRGIRVNVVAAGVTQSGMTAPMFENDGMLDPVLARTPLGRTGTPADIAGAALFLASDAASWITGQVVTVDGGYTVFG